MAGISKRLSLISTIAIGIAFAGCGGPQQSGQAAFPQLQGNAASTPLPHGGLSHRPSTALPRFATSQPLLYLGDEYYNSIDLFPLTGPNQKQIGSITNGIVGPWGLSLDANNTLYVANAFHHSVTVYPYGSSSPSMTYSKKLTNRYTRWPIQRATSSSGIATSRATTRGTSSSITPARTYRSGARD